MSLLQSNPNWGDDAFMDSMAMQQEASALGFDWLDVHGVLEKVREEVDELDQALREQNDGNIRHELGDLFLALVNVARFSGVNPSVVMREANTRFNRRFVAMRELIEEKGKRFDECSFSDLNSAWDTVKSRGDDFEKTS